MSACLGREFLFGLLCVSGMEVCQFVSALLSILVLRVECEI